MASQTFTLILLLSIIIGSDAAASIGVNYGTQADDLSPPDKVVELLKSQGITNVKIYDTNATVLRALAKSGINVVAALPNELLAKIATDQSFTDNWVKSNISPFHPATNIEAIAVGNEVFATSPQNTNNLVQAMINVHASLKKFSLDNNIKISSPLRFDTFVNTWPPSAATFDPQWISVIEPMLNFLEQTGSYLMANVYPYFAYSDKREDIPLEYALFEDKSGVLDPKTNLVYHSLFDAQIDAIYAAMASLQRTRIKIKVTESGWPSKGKLLAKKTERILNEIDAASVANAKLYNGNLVRRVFSEEGTPSRPEEPLNVYIFALFNEKGKEGDPTENNFGLFYPNMQKVYEIPLTKYDVEHEGPPVGPTWCVANENADPKKLQEALDYACGEGGANCGPIQPGGPCYNPNTLQAHASYAFNSYYQNKAHGPGTCVFGGVAQVVSQPPSFVNCEQSKTSWCVANMNAGEKQVQEALDYACGEGGADCSPIQPGGPCYNPNTLEAHASYAFNSYYQKKARGLGTCVFKGAARVVSQPPRYGNCKFPIGY